MRFAVVLVGILTCAVPCPAQDHPAPGWTAAGAFRAEPGSQEAADAGAAARLWERFRRRAAETAAADPKAAEEGTALAVLVRRGRFAALPYPAGMADGRSRHLRPAAAGPLQPPEPTPAGRAAWLRAAFRDGLDPAYAAARAALGDPTFAKPDGTPRPSALARALESADASAAAWIPAADRGRGPAAMAAWGRFREVGAGAPMLPPVAEAELTAALEWGSLRSGGRIPNGAARGALARLTVAWMARERQRELRELATLEVVSVRDAPGTFAAVAEAAGPANLAALMAAARAEGFPEGGPEHRAAALALLDESPEGSWGVPVEVRRALRRAAKASATVPLVSPEQALAALDAMPGMAEPSGSPGRAGDDEAVAAAFREPPAVVLAWGVEQEWENRADQSRHELAAAQRINRAMGEALDAYDAWSKEQDRSRKDGAAVKAREAVARLRACLDQNGVLLPPELVAKGRDVVALAGSKLGN